MNNKYFHALMKTRAAYKSIISLTNSEGILLTEPEDIKNEILCFYKRLMGSASSQLPTIDRNIMRDGPVLNDEK